MTLATRILSAFGLKTALADPYTCRALPPAYNGNDDAPQEFQQQPSQQQLSGSGGSCCLEQFDCNVCCCPARHPVVTPCGHLYCWKCLYRASLSDVRNHRPTSCPTCQFKIDVKLVVPVYGRTDPEPEDSYAGSDPIPPRPVGQRPPPPLPAVALPQTVPQTGTGTWDHLGVRRLTDALVRLVGGGEIGDQGAEQISLSAELQHQAFLSRLLLLIGSFVILCLLMF